MIHDFGDDEVVFEHLKVVRSRWRDRERRAPMTVAARAVFMPDAGAVAVPDFQRVSGDCDAAAKRRKFAAAPDFLHLVNAVGCRVVGGRSVVGDFADAPLDAAKCAGSLRVRKRARGEDDCIDGIAERTAVSDGGFSRQKACVHGVANRIEVGHASACADCGIAVSGGIGPAGEEERLHVGDLRRDAAGVCSRRSVRGAGPAGEVGGIKCRELCGGIVHDVIDGAAVCAAVAIEQQVAEFADRVAVRDGHRGARSFLRKQPGRRIDDVVMIVERVVNEVPAAVPVRSKRCVPIVRHEPQFSERVAGDGLEIPDEVFHAMASGRLDENIVVPDGFLDRVVFVVERHVDVLLQRCVGRRLVHVVADVVEVLAEIDAERCLAPRGEFAVLHPVTHLVKVAALKVASCEEFRTVGEFERLKEAPKITKTGVRRVRVLDDSEADPMALGNRYAAQRPHFSAYLVRQSPVVVAFVSE